MSRWESMGVDERHMRHKQRVLERAGGSRESGVVGSGGMWWEYAPQLRVLRPPRRRTSRAQTSSASLVGGRDGIDQTLGNQKYLPITKTL